LKIQETLECFSGGPGAIADQFCVERSGFGVMITRSSRGAAEIGANEYGELTKSGGIASAWSNLNTRLARRRLEPPKLN
jgi:hypothetical protein